MVSSTATVNYKLIDTIKTTHSKEVNNEFNVTKTLSSKDITYSEYKELTNVDINELFPIENNKIKYSDAMALRNNANEFEDEALGKLLFEFQLSDDNSFAKNELKYDIQGTMFLKTKDIEIKYAEEVILPTIEIFVRNGSKSSPEYQKELAKRENAFEFDKKIQYASKHNKISSNDFFNWLEKSHQKVKDYVHNPLAISDLRQTEYYKHIDEIIYETTKLKEKYENLKNDENALLNYLTKDYKKEVFA